MPREDAGPGGRPPIIAIGASAGGLEPLEAFFEAAPTEAGWAFFVIQHLSPDYRSMMDELLARKSALAIRHAEDGLSIEPDTIYLNPPDSVMTLDGGVLTVSPFERGAQPKMPIDAFFESLADDDPRDAVAIVLSGSGADGARGAAAVQRAGGRVIVQSPKGAKFDSMPRAVIASETVDRVLEPGEMPRIISELLAQGPGRDAEAASGPKDPHAAILGMIERAHHLDFSGYKTATVLRRVDRRRSLRGHADLDAFRRELARDPEALEELYYDLLIGVTEFYRDPEGFAALERLVLPDIVSRCEPDGEIRVWAPGCASGEEAYSLAIALTETMRAADLDRRIRVIATDVHRGSIETAAAGVYPKEAVAKLPDALRRRYFRPHRDGVAVEAEIRRSVIFSVHNALTDPPFMRLDLVSCRNFMIYLDEAMQARLLSMIEFGLKPGGALFLGSSESLGELAQDFTPLDSHWRIFRWTGNRSAAADAAFPVNLQSRAAERTASPRRAAVRPPLDSVDLDRPNRRDRAALLRGYDALLKRYAPSAILIGDGGEVLTWFGDASDYIDTLNDLADRTVEQIVHDGLHYAINVGIERIRRNKETRYERDATLEVGARKRRLRVVVEGLERAEAPIHFLVTLQRLDQDDAATADAVRESVDGGEGETDEALMARRVRELERDLKLTEQSLQYVTERLETSGEELQASNEELQASNEELQASNEELQSSNEELHAVNEELVNVSTQHQRKIDQLTALNEDTEFVFEALGIGVVMVDADERIRRFSEVAAQTLALMPHDVGRPIAHLAAQLSDAAPADMAKRARESGEIVSGTGVVGGETVHLRALPHGREDGPGGVALVMARSGALSELGAAVAMDRAGDG